MAILPVNLARVSNLLRSNTASQQIARTEQDLLDIQNQLSTGKRINAPSDDPGDASIVMQLQKTMEQRKAYASNLDNANSQLSNVDSTLSNLNDLLQQAQTIASANVGSDVTAEQRQSAAAIVQSLYSQAISTGNTQFDGTYLFAGDKGTDAPFVTTPNGVQFIGSTNVLQNASDESTSLAFGVNGSDVFGALSTRVQGATNLGPSLTLGTRLADLKGTAGNGIHAGSIVIGNGATSKIVNLSAADTMQNVVNAINAAGVGNITASVATGASGITLSTTGTDNISVQDVGGGTTAADLGILQTTGAGAGVAVNGANIHPAVTMLTPLSALRGGAGIDPAGLKITNGNSTATVSLSGVTTVEGLLNAINGSGANVRAQINADGTGIDILNPTQGAAMTIGENGGTTAADLGVRSFGPSTLLSELNGGAGVRTVTPGPDFNITRSDGTSFGVSLNGAVTVQDVIGKINLASGGTATTGVGISATFAANGNGITLTDSAGGAASPVITPQNFSNAAADLGLTTPATGNTITGKDVNPVVAQGVFANLAKLRDALNANNQSGITAAAEGLKGDHDRVVRIRGQVGAQVQEIKSRQNGLDDQNVATQSLLSSLADTDFATTVTKFQTLQTALQATLQASGKTMNLSLMDFLA